MTILEEHYHVEGLTQAQIGERMNLTRRRINELLAAALEQGVVRISFSSPLSENVELEGMLRDRFGLEDAVVAPSPADPAHMHAVIGIVPVDHPLNRQVISPELDAYRGIPTRILASGGPHKRAILLATLKAGLATAIVTDAESARMLLAAADATR